MVKHPQHLKEAVRALPTKSLRSSTQICAFFNQNASPPVNLCCTALLASRQRSLTREQLTEQLDCYLDLMRNVPYSVDSTTPASTASELIDHALQM
ncbi:hypothetical protein, partial [Acinetobacter indicus]|uniref:hypothetical protein n=1 Tax=Acinetobacter indicus TaxID=756892 RepID=UPI001C0A09A7